MNDFLSALGLLTIFPVRATTRVAPTSFAYFPVVGLIIGMILVAASFLARLFFPSLVAASLVVALWAALTGALHLDGLSDACDGLFAATTRERRLEIMHDVHVGAFGVVGIVLAIVLKVVALASLDIGQLQAGNHTGLPLLAAILARWAMVYAAAYPLARAEGMAAMFRTGLSRRDIFAATMLAAIAALAFGRVGLFAFIATFVVATILARFALARLGGLTGDVYGMICESVEIAVLLVGNVI